MKYRLYLISTKYTLLNSIILENQRKKISSKKSILVIFDTSNKLTSSIERLKKTRVFDNIFILPFINNWSKLKLLRVFIWPNAFFKANKINKKYVFYEVFSQNFIYACLFNRVFNFKKINLIEDGLSSYTGLNLDKNFRSSALTAADKLLFLGNLIPEVKNLYLHQPQLYHGEAAIKKMPKMDINLLDSIFLHNKKNSNTRYRFFFLGSPLNTIHKLLEPNSYNEDVFKKDIVAKINYFASVIEDKKNIYRLHPSEELENHHKNFLIDNGTDYWELICSDLMPNQCLVSFFSTASITPKLIHDKEPAIIFLYKLMPTYHFVGADKFVNNLKKIYRVPTNIHTPTSLSDLNELLKKLDSKNDH